MTTLAPLLIVSCLAPVALSTSGPMPGPGVHIIDVGQGAAALLVGSEGDAVLVDSGPASGAEAVLHALEWWEVDTLALWIHTHFDADHLAGFARVLAGVDGRLRTADDVELGVLWDRGLDAPLPDSEALALYLQLAPQRERPVAGQRFVAPGLRVEVLDLDTPVPSVDADENLRGLALCAEVGDLRVLIPGDLPAQHAAAAAQACGPVDLLWASHHGAADGTSSSLLDAARPHLTVISAGHGNLYCHPSSVTLARLHDHSVAILDGAGFEPDEDHCAPLVEALGARHHVLAGGLWIAGAGQGEAWIDAPGGWILAPESLQITR